MRDAATLEASGKPTAIVVNDVFAPIAHGTAALLALRLAAPSDLEPHA
jgi:hypothetical protein